MSEAPTKAAPKKLTPAERRRRRARLAWIPTGVIALIIIAAVIIALEFQRGGGGKTVVEEPGDSTFTRAGVAEIVKTADVQFDVKDPQRASNLGLPANGRKSFGPFLNIAAEVDLVGTHGTKMLYVDSFAVTTKNDYITTVTTTTHEYDYTDLHSKLVEEEVVGITPAQLGAFEDSMPVGAGGPSSSFALTVGTGTALGVPTKLAVKCSGPAGCVITSTTTLPQN